MLHPSTLSFRTSSNTGSGAVIPLTMPSGARLTLKGLFYPLHQPLSYYPLIQRYLSFLKLSPHVLKLAALSNYHKLSGLVQLAFILTVLEARSPKLVHWTETKVSAELSPLWKFYGRIHFLAFPPLRDAFLLPLSGSSPFPLTSEPGAWHPHTSLLPWSQWSFSVAKAPCLPFTGILVITFSACPDNPR